MIVWELRNDDVDDDDYGARNSLYSFLLDKKENGRKQQKMNANLPASFPSPSSSHSFGLILLPLVPRTLHLSLLI